MEVEVAILQEYHPKCRDKELCKSQCKRNIIDKHMYLPLNSCPAAGDAPKHSGSLHIRIRTWPHQSYWTHWNNHINSSLHHQMKKCSEG